MANSEWLSSVAPSGRLFPARDIAALRNAQHLASSIIFTLIISSRHCFAIPGVVVVPSFEADENQNPPASKAELDGCISAQRCRGVLEVLHLSISHLTLHTTHLTLHTTHFTPHTSHHTLHTTHLTPHTSHLTPHTSHLTPHTATHSVSSHVWALRMRIRTRIELRIGCTGKPPLSRTKFSTSGRLNPTS